MQKTIASYEFLYQRKQKGAKFMHISLNNAYTMPILGFGTYKLKGKEAYSAVRSALELGYRLIDTAHFYDNEQEVGAALRDAIAEGLVKREELFVTTKIWNEDQRQGRQEEVAHESLKLLGLDYLDLMLIHWPVAPHYHKTWSVMEKMQDEGYFRSIGVCNFNSRQLEDLLSGATHKVQVNQMEHHPYLQDTACKALCDKLGIAYQAWSPLGRGMELDDPSLIKLAEKYNKSVAQIILRWHLEQGICAIPKASSQKRIKENIDIFDFCLLEEELELISKLECGRYVNPASSPENFDF